MALHHYMIFFAVVCPLIHFSNMEKLVLTVEQFAQYGCENICTEDRYKSQLKKICDRIDPQDKPSKDAKCMKDIHVEMSSENNFVTWFRKEVGMCTLSNGVKKCVTMGPKPNTVYVFPYANTLCAEPDEVYFEFPALSATTSFDRARLLRTESTEKPSGGGGILGAIARWFCCCFGR